MFSIPSVRSQTSVPLPLHYSSMVTGYKNFKKMAFNGVTVLSNATTTIFRGLNQKFGFSSYLHISLDCSFRNIF